MDFKDLTNMKQLKRLLIIPARGGSKRIKDKNIKKFKNKPIIYYTIENAKSSRLFDKIHVSTDSKKISKIVRKKNIKIEFMRPKSLSGGTIPLFEVYKFVVRKFENLGYKFDEIWSIMPCSPNLDKRDLIKISKFYNKLKIKVPVLSVSRFKVPVQWAFKMKKSKKLIPHNKSHQLKRSQDVTANYFDAGQFCIYPGANFKKLNFISKNYFYKGYELPIKKSIDIDDIEDWKLAEKLY